MKRYLGVAIRDQRKLYVEQGAERRELVHLMRHSFRGFAWGWSCGGTLDAARTILADLLGREEAEDLYEAFAQGVMAEATICFELSEARIREWISGQQ